MPRVVTDGRFDVCVFADDHNPPHCHVYWDGDGKMAMVRLRTLNQDCGDKLPKQAKKLLAIAAEELRREWNRLNPNKRI